MSLSYLIWGLWVLAFLVLEFTGLFHVTPWHTLSDTVWSLEDINRWLRVLALCGLIVLTTHIVARWP
jgi:hypothetical protein